MRSPALVRARTYDHFDGGELMPYRYGFGKPLALCFEMPTYPPWSRTLRIGISTLTPPSTLSHTGERSMNQKEQCHLIR